MPVSDHLKVAATELLKGIDLLRQEIDMLRREEHELTSLLSRQTSGLMDQLRLHNNVIKSLTSGDAANEHAAIRDIDAQIAEGKHKLDQDKRRIQDQIREKEQMIDYLQRQSNSLMP